MSRVRALGLPGLDEHADSVWALVERRGMDSCWPWRGRRFRGRNGKPSYGYTQIGGRTVQAHRLVWALTHGGLADSVYVLHRCDNPPCCNPRHLFLGTQVENMRDMARKNRGSIKLTGEQVDEIRRRRAAGEKIVALGEQFGISAAHAYLVGTGGRRPHLAGPRATQRRQRAPVLRILALRAGGMRWRDIAEVLGLTIGQIWASVCPQPSRRPRASLAGPPPISIAPWAESPELTDQQLADLVRRFGLFRQRAEAA